MEYFANITLHLLQINTIQLVFLIPEAAMASARLWLRRRCQALLWSYKHAVTSQPPRSPPLSAAPPPRRAAVSYS